MKKYPPTVSSTRYPNIDILYSRFIANQRWRARKTIQTTDKIYRKTVGEYKDIENDFYSNDSGNDDLESTFQKGSFPYI